MEWAFFFLKLTYTCSCLYLRIKPSKSRKKSYFFSFYLFSYCIKQHRENIQYIQYYIKSKSVYCTHQTGELTLSFLMLINLHWLLITANFLHENNSKKLKAFGRQKYIVGKSAFLYSFKSGYIMI